MQLGGILQLVVLNWMGKWGEGARMANHGSRFQAAVDPGVLQKRQCCSKHDGI